MTPQQMDRYLQAIVDFSPKCIYGYASSIALLSAHAREKGRPLRLPQLKVVCTTGEPLHQHQRDLIQQVFGVPVANEFGSRDIGFTAHESPAGQMLLMSESILLEVLDDRNRPTKPGECGEAVITALESFAQPFIRYRTGDIVKMSSGKCLEGRGLHVLQEVTGRATDFVVRTDGAIMHALSVIYVMREISGIGEFKIVQQQLDRFEIYIVPNASWVDDDLRTVKHGLEKRLGNEVKLEIKLTDHIAAEASGKHRYVVSNVKLPGELDVVDHA